MTHRPGSRVLAVIAATVLFGVFCVLPSAYVVWSVFRVDLAPSFSFDERQRGLFLNTVILGSGTAAFASLIGVPLGLALGRLALPRRMLLRLLLATPVLLPPYIIALAWTYVTAGAWIYSLPGTILVLGLAFYPIPMVATEAGVRRVDPRLEEAGLLVAPASRVLQRITLRLALPMSVSSALIVFVMAISEFAVPGLLRVPVYTTEVFTAFAALYDTTRALTLALPLLALAGIATLTAAWVFGARVVSPRRVSGSTAVVFGPSHLALAAALITLTAALVVPIGTLALEAATSGRALLRADAAVPTIRSVLLAAAASSVAVIVAVILGYARSRIPTGAGAVDAVVVTLFAVPGTIVGIGLIGVWNRDGVFGAPYATDMMLVLGYLARFLPIAIVILAAAARSVPASHEEAAAIAGARWSRTMARIVLPQLGIGAAAAWTVVFVLAFGELAVSILVAPPGSDTLPIRIYTIIANTPSSHIAALSLLQAAVIFVPVAIAAGTVWKRRMA